MKFEFVSCFGFRASDLSQSGQIILIALVFMAVVTTIVVSLVGYAGVQTKSHRQALGRVQGLSIAEAGAELAVWKLNNQSGYTGETNATYGNGVYTVTITNLSGSSKLVKVDSYVPNATNPTAHRSVQLTLNTGTTNVSFNYGVQIGAGGLQMDNNSSVVGNVYSNGQVLGSSGAAISGTAFSAGSSGKIDSVTVSANANAHIVSNSTVGATVNAYSLTGSTVSGSVSVNSMSSCTIGGNAVYNTKTSCTVGGTSTTPNNNVPADPVTQNLPISQTQIDTWTADATAGGVVGDQSISGTVSLGPKKINGDLTINNNATLKVTGTLWVTGKISINNNGTIKLDSSYGSTSGVVIAGVSGSSSAGKIDLSNNAQVLGSGTAGSFMLVLSQRNNISEEAIDISNNVTGAIFYAGTGVIEVSNSAGAKELTAYKIHLNNNATVTYDSGLANAQFSSGPAGGWEVSRQTWQLLQ